MGDIPLLLKGLAVGLAIAAPVGPIGVLCVRRTLLQGAWVGLLSGLGAACADTVYGAVAGFGLSSVAAFLLDYQVYLRVFGGGFLLLLGLRILARGPVTQDSGAALGRTSLIGAFASCFFLTLTNPATILSFVAIFAGLGLVQRGTDYVAATSLVLGVFFGSAFWWLALSLSVGLLRQRMSDATLVWLNRLSGSIILGFGVFALGVMLV